jgi:hypothetical protein
VTQIISTGAYDGPQLILMNDFSTLDEASNVNPVDLYNNLPNQTEGFWDVSWTSTTDYTKFYNETYDQRTNMTSEMPNRMTSYYIYKADKTNQHWQFSSFLNLTSSGVTAFYPQFMYEAIIKTATDNSEF